MTSTLSSTELDPGTIKHLAEAGLSAEVVITIGALVSFEFRHSASHRGQCPLLRLKISEPFEVGPLILSHREGCARVSFSPDNSERAALAAAIASGDVMYRVTA
jgi:hypothetical protein